MFDMQIGLRLFADHAEFPLAEPPSDTCLHVEVGIDRRRLARRQQDTALLGVGEAGDELGLPVQGQRRLRPQGLP